MRYLMFLLSLAFVATVPATALASSATHASGVVLSVASEKHVLRIVEGQRVDDLRYRGSLPAGTSAGAKLSFATSGRHAAHLVVGGRVDHVVVYGVVVRVGKLLALRLTDSSLIPLPAGSHLKVGAAAHRTVRFTSSTTTGGSPPSSTPTTTGPSSPGNAGCALPDCSFDVTGTVSAIDDTSGAITVTPLSGGADLTAEPGTINTDSVFVGDFVHVAGTQSIATGDYTLTTLDELPGCDTPDCTVTFDATVDDIEGTTVTVADDDGDEYPLTATAAQLASIQVDDNVHIVAVQDPVTGDYRVKTISVLPAGSTPQ